VLVRLALAVLVTAGAGCGSEDPALDAPDAGAHDDAGAFDAGAGEPDGGGSTMIVSGSTYLERLLERRKSVDLYPWAELFQGGAAGCLANGAAANSLVTLSVRSPWAMSFGEYTTYSVEHEIVLGPLNAFAEVPGQILFQHGPRSSDQATRAFATQALIGHPHEGWWGLGAGAFFESQDLVTAPWNNIGAVPGAGGLGLQLSVVGRGYREYPKGAISPVQFTRREYAEQGYSFEPYDYGARVTVAAATPVNQQTNAQLTVDRDFLADGLTITMLRGGIPADGSATAVLAGSPLVLVRVETDRPLMASPGVNRFALVGEPNRRTGWQWLIPVTLPAGQLLNFWVSNPIADVAQLDVDFVLHGHLLLKP